MKTILRPLNPFRASVLLFAIFILFGSFLISFVGSSRPIRFIDALFTMTSAACVTGLTVLDTGADFNILGQTLILLWLQIGGLGIMTISTVMLLATGKRPGMGARMVIEDAFTHRGASDLGTLVIDVLKFTLLFEAFGAAILFVKFREILPPETALYSGIFHSVSAFCNAGFSLFPNNLEGFAKDPLVNTTVAFLIVSGGIGFVVLREIRDLIMKRNLRLRRLSLHSKVVLTTSGLLITVGAMLILLLEWDHTLRDMALGSKVMASVFQSVTARTAGFNTIPIGEMTSASLVILILLMFVGGSSGSTAGGIKTGTLATLCSLAVCRLRGYQAPHLFGRTISQGSVARAMSVTMACFALVMSAIVVLQATEVAGSGIKELRAHFLDLVFEVVSAFGTVGLSTGVTSQLTDGGKLVIILVMFLGRLGPLAVAVAASRQKTAKYRYAEESIMVG